MKLWKRSIAFLIALMLFGCVPLAEVFAAEDDTTENTDSIDLTTMVDYSQLKHQIAIVNGLTSYDYTAESWAELQDAYNEGVTALDRVYGQYYVDRATERIKAAIAALVEMDYTPLENALAAVYNLIKENPELHDVWVQLDLAVAEKKVLLVSGDQAAVNEAAVYIHNLLEQRLQYVDQEQTPEIVIQEVEVEVPPKDDYCNIPIHRTWPMLFFISAALNVVLVILIVCILVKKKNTTDDTPLVSYDIDDDIDLI